MRSVWIVRSAIFLGLAGSLALLLWSVFVRLLPTISEHREKALKMSLAADELELLRSRWTPPQIEEMKRRHERAQKALFGAGSELESWQEEIQEKARMRVLEANLKLDDAKPLPGSADGINTVTAHLDIYPSQVLNSTNAPYRRLVAFADAVADSPKRVELVELSVIGNSNSVSQAQAVVQLLSTERQVQ